MGTGGSKGPCMAGEESPRSEPAGTSKMGSSMIRTGRSQETAFFRGRGYNANNSHCQLVCAHRVTAACKLLYVQLPFILVR